MNSTDKIGLLPWLTYQKVGTTEMRPYLEGEDLSGVSVSPDHQPKRGDMIARDPNNPSDLWLVDQDYFLRNYEPTETTTKE